MNRMKRVAALCLTAAMAMSLAACGGGNSVKSDGQVYLQGLLDNLYLGQQNEDYLALFEMTAEDAAQEHEDGLEAEVYRFAYICGIEDLNDEIMAEIREVLKRVYSHAKYTIKSSSKLESGNYAMEVEVEPIDVMIRMTEDDLTSAWEGTMEHFEATMESLSAMSDEEFYLLDNYYTARVLELVEERLGEVGYEPAVTLTMTLQQDAEGYYDFSQDDFDKLDAKIMPYGAD